MANAKEFLIKLFLESDNKGADKTMASLKKIRASLDLTAALGTKMSLMLTAPLVAFAATSVKTVAEFEAQMAKVGAVSQATAGELEALENQARKLGATTKFSATQAAEAMAFLSMAGFNARQTMAAMPSTLKLASAAALDMGTAADITSNILTGFAMEISELGYVNDVLVKATTSSNTNLTQLGEAMKYVAPTAAGAGQSIEDVTAALGALGNAGIQGSMAGTTLRGVLSELLNPSTATAKILKDLGVNVRTSTGAMRPLISILQDLGESGIQTSQVMEIFGDRAGPGMVALIEQGSDSLNRFSQALKNSKGTADKVASDLENSLGGAWRELQSAYQELQISLMQAGVFDALKSLIGVAKNLVNSFASLDEGTKKYTIAIAALVAAIGPVVFLTSKLISGFSFLGTGIAMTTKYILGANASLKGLSVGLAAVRVGVIALRTVLVASGIGALIEGLGYAVNWVISKFEDGADSLGDFNEKIEESVDVQTKLAQLGEVGSDKWAENVDAVRNKYDELNGAVQRNNAELEKSKRVRKALNAEYESGAIDTEAYRKAMQYAWIEELKYKSYSENLKRKLAAVESELNEITAQEAEAELERKAKHEKFLKNEETLVKSIANIKRNFSLESLSNAEKLKAKEQDLKDVESEIVILMHKRGSSKDVEERIQLLKSERAKTQEYYSLRSEISKLEKASLDDAKKEFALEEAKLKSNFKEQELEILRAKASGNADLVKTLEEALELEKLTLSLRKEGATDSAARLQAQEILALEKEILRIEVEAEKQRKIALDSTEKLRKENAYELFNLELSIERARLSGNQRLERELELQLSAKNIQAQAIEMMEDYGIGYEDALANLKAIDDLENKRSKKNQKSEGKDVVYGKTVSQIEKEQAKVQKLLNSNNFEQIERGQKQAQSFEDKYGINVNDSARSYKGRDRKTGKLIAPQTGKEFEEIQALEALKETPQKNVSFKKKSFARAQDLGAQTEPQSEDFATVVNDTQPAQIAPANSQQVAPTQPAQNTPQPSQNNGNAADKNNAGLLDALKALATQIIETNKILKDNQSLLKDIKNGVNADYI